MRLFTFLLFVASVQLLFSETSERFYELNAKRQGRLPLIEKTISLQLGYEQEDGYLRVSSKNTCEVVAELVKIENLDRKSQFQIIASQEESSLEQVAKEFALQNGFNRYDSAEIALRIHGSNTVGASLMPAFVSQFLTDELDVADLLVRKSGVETRILFKASDEDTEYKAIDIIAHGSSTAFAETSSNKHVGLAGGYCDIGMASRPVKDAEAAKIVAAGFGDVRDHANVFPIAVDGVAVIVHPENPITELSVTEISQLFSGEIRDWSALGASEQKVVLYCRDEQSGTFDTFKSRVLKPTQKKLSSTLGGRFEENSQIVKKVSQSKGAIGFVGLSALDSSVRALSVKASSESRAFFPNRLTIKSLDYPLSRLLYLYAPSERKSMASELLRFAMSQEGQSVVDNEGLIGQGVATAVDREQAADLKEALVSDQTIPLEYREAILDADREDSAFNVRFSIGSSTPDANSQNNIKRLVSLLANPGMEKTSVVLIGFTDSVGASDKNKSLSHSRARSVSDILQKNGVSSIKVYGLGEEMAVGDNLTDSGRAANRRVEVWLKRAS